MLILPIANDLTVGIRWSHQRRGKDAGRSVTTCTITNATHVGRTDEQPVMGIASASCALKDNFNYETGRKVSMRRALRYTGLTKAQRQTLWQQYHRRPRPTSAQKAVA